MLLKKGMNTAKHLKLLKLLMKIFHLKYKITNETNIIMKKPAFLQVFLYLLCLMPRQS